ncbi:Baseplate wedge protein gp53, bacteriophage T4 [uncultured Caudovirales phage]|uniref:Baseplate wedge protein gp53, bacteriophage T4 n=1 Tax=uncultured Caudovirales phage TaxID=2100421 RepID=A0A6J7WZZ0_9CAUD|nr:Baseplate wedge protein gp53, bacteriophage T4 [uncultured Caudovirales phage]
MYFKDFPNFLYDFKYGDTLKTSIVTDITRNIRVRKEILANITLYDEYDIEDGETPELIAEKIYGDAKYHWVIMLVNDTNDYVTDFPLEENRLLKVIQDKYDNIYAIHHYENSDGYVVNSDDADAYPVSNNEYERRLNEQKRKIKIVSPRLLSTILKNFKDLL